MYLQKNPTGNVLSVDSLHERRAVRGIFCSGWYRAVQIAMEIGSVNDSVS